MTEIEKLMAWRVQDELRTWTLYQSSQAENEKWERLHLNGVSCSLRILRRTTTGKWAGSRLMDDRYYYGYGATADEAIREALKEAREAGDA